MFFNKMLNQIKNKNQQLTIINTNTAQYNQKLIEAIKTADVSEVKSILEKGADPNACDKEQQPAIVIAAGSETNSAELVKALISESKIPVDLDQRSKSKGDWTALMTAVSSKNYETVNLLLNAGCNTKLKNGYDLTASKIARVRNMQELSDTIKQFRKLHITPQLLDKQAYEKGESFAKTEYCYKHNNKKTYFTTKLLLPKEVLTLVGSFLYPEKARLYNHFVYGLETIKQKSMNTKPIFLLTRRDKAKVSINAKATIKANKI